MGKRDRSRSYVLSVFCLAFLFLVLPSTSLQAGGWGKNATVVTYEDTKWNQVYFDMNGCHFEAWLPNYAGTSMSNGRVVFKGLIEQTAGYLITTSMNGGFSPPANIEGFIAMVQEANYSYQVKVVHGKKGVLYAVDLIPPEGDQEGNFWRFFATKNRVIQMGTDDQNASRRAYFFDSMVIHH